MCLTKVCFGLRELCFGVGHLCFRLAHPALRVDTCWLYTEIAFVELCVEHCDVLLGTEYSRLGLQHQRSLLLFTGTYLLVVNHGKQLPSFNVVAFANLNVANAARDLGRDGCIITFNSTADLDETFWRGWRANQEVPDTCSGSSQDHDRECYLHRLFDLLFF